MLVLRSFVSYRNSPFSAAGQLAVNCTSATTSAKNNRLAYKEYWRGISMAAIDKAPITINDRLYRQVKEGQATILAPYQHDRGKSKNVSTQSGQPRNNDEGEQAVFYNPIQQYNRDLSVLAILVYGESAVAMKQIKQKKSFGRSLRKKARAKEQNVVPRSGEVSEVNRVSVTGNKRKVDDAEIEGDVAGEDTKRTKADEQSADAEIEVEQLGPDGTATDMAASGKVNGGNSLPEPSKRHQTPFTILDALSASGLRAIRYAKEIPFATTIVANDMLPEAVDAINLNIEYNELKGKVYSNVGDARQFMYSKSGDEAKTSHPGYVHKFDVVDLDPYGTAAPFLDAAIQALADGGMLCVTCTDAGVWASNGYTEKAFALYSGMTLKGAHSHEAGLRLILHSVATTAAKYGISIEPLLSLSIDFYARLFIRLHKSQQEVKLLAGTTMYVYNCDQGCGAWHTQLAGRNSKSIAKNGEVYFKHGYSQAPSTGKHCQHCGTKTHLGGPMWAGPLHNPVFVQRLLDRLPSLDKTIYGTTERVRGMLTVALEEENLNWPPKDDCGNKTTSPREAINGTGSPGATPDGFVMKEYSAASIIPRLPPELLSPSPLFFLPTYIAKTISIMTPSEDAFRSAFLALGYSCTRSHCKPGSFKTNAPWSVTWEIAREWVRQMDSDKIPRLLGEGEFAEQGKRSTKKGSPGYVILKKLKERNGDVAEVQKVKESLVEKLGYGMNAVDIESREDLQVVLRAALYELEHGSASATARVSNHSDRVFKSSEDIVNMPKISGKEIIDAGGDPSELEIIFDANLAKAFRERGGRGQKIVRYQINPRANWGPMVRAGTS